MPRRSLVALLGLVVGASCSPSQGEVFQIRDTVEPSDVLRVTDEPTLDFSDWPATPQEFVSVAGDGLDWSDPATWEQGEVPTSGSRVTISPGSSVRLAGSTANLAELIVSGTLRDAPERPFDLVAQRIEVSGRLAIGSPDEPRVEQAVITLAGPGRSDRLVDDDLFALVVRPGAELVLAGAFSRPYTLLVSDVEPGADALEVADDVDWPVGTTVAVAPSGFAPEEVELRTIAETDGQRLRVDPVAHSHRGQVSVLAGQEVDDRAEVAGLWRPIIVRGAPTIDQPDVGGMVRIEGASGIDVSGVAFVRMGQQPELLRPAIYIVDQPIMSTFEGNTFFDSRHGCVHVRRASNLIFRDNVAVGVEGHCFALITAIARDNTLADNVVMGIEPPAVEAIDSWRSANDDDKLRPEDAQTPAAFYWRHPLNVFTGNRAAGGTDALGYWLEVPGSETDYDGEPIEPLTTGVETFQDNVAHSFASDEPLDLSATDDTLPATGFRLSRTSSVGLGDRSRLGPMLFYNITNAALDIDSGATVSDLVAVENRVAVDDETSGTNLIFSGGFIAGWRDAPPSREWSGEVDAPTGVVVRSAHHHWIGATFANFEASGDSPFGRAFVFDPSRSLYGTVTRDLAFENAERYGVRDRNEIGWAMTDIDGTLLGTPGSLAFPGESESRRPELFDISGCEAAAVEGAVVCPFGVVPMTYARNDPRWDVSLDGGDAVTMQRETTYAMRPDVVYDVAPNRTSWEVNVQFQSAFAPEQGVRLRFPGTTVRAWEGGANPNRSAPAPVVNTEELQLSTDTTTVWVDGDSTVVRIVVGESIVVCADEGC